MSNSDSTIGVRRAVEPTNLGMPVLRPALFALACSMYTTNNEMEYSIVNGLRAKTAVTHCPCLPGTGSTKGNESTLTE